DRGGARHVAVVNEALARFAIPGIMGQVIRIGDGPDDPWYTVVGVVKDAWGNGFGAQRGPLYAVYLSSLQRPPRVAERVVQARRGSAAPARDRLRPRAGGGGRRRGRPVRPLAGTRGLGRPAHRADRRAARPDRGARAGVVGRGAGRRAHSGVAGGAGEPGAAR